MPFDAGSPPGIDRAAKGPDPPNEGLQPDSEGLEPDDSRSGKMLNPNPSKETKLAQRRNLFVSVYSVYTLCQNTTKLFRRFLAEAQILKCKCCRRPGMEI